MRIDQYRHTVLFYFLATVIPWGCWIIAGYFSHHEGSANVLWGSGLGFLGLVTPAVISIALVAGNPTLRADVLGRLISLRNVPVLYLAVACLLMLASILLAQLISLLFGYSPSQFSLAGHFSFSSGVFPVWFLLLVAPILEELAWHSYGTDCLRRRYSLFATSMIFAAFWGVWHVPLALIKGYYQSNLVQTGWLYSANFLVSLFPFVLLMNWLYYRTGRSILVAIVFHVTAGYFNEIFATAPMSKVIQTGLLCILALYLMRKDPEFFFERSLDSDQVQLSRVP